MHTVMGQIDGGPFEESIVLEEMARYPQLHERYRPAPARYCDEWRAQCASARRIVVNSPWAMHCLEGAGIPREKMVIVPLFYETTIRDASPRPLPTRFGASRPLRVLFLGQLNLRKGAGPLLDAIRRMKDAPVEFVVVGSSSITIPEDVRALSNFSYAGRADRSQVHDHYANADVFILPTLSDGFALTQLEARAHGLPIIASRRCGEVVTQECDGLLLDEVTADAITAAIYRLLSDPDMLHVMRRNATPGAGDLAGYGRRFVHETCC
jgi:glycosyltransferase involved in cell wall biosynthesis